MNDSASADQQTVVVTGGAGFIGSHVADRLVDQGRTVVVIDDLSSGRRENVPAAATFVEGSVSDAALMLRVASEHRPAMWFHLAAQADVRVSVDDPVGDAETNVIGTISVLEAAATTRAPVVFASTGGAIYGPGSDRPTSETATAEPLSPYGAAKLAAEAYIQQHARLTGIRHVILRFANVYGPRQDPHGEAGVVAIFGGRVLAGEAPTIFGDGNQTRDYVYVEDVADATLAAGATCGASATAPVEPDDQAGVIVPVFNIGSGVETTVNELWQAVQRQAGTTIAASHADARTGELRASALDASLARKELSVSLGTTLDEGLGHTIAWMRSPVADTVHG